MLLFPFLLEKLILLKHLAVAVPLLKVLLLLQNDISDNLSRTQRFRLLGAAIHAVYFLFDVFGSWNPYIGYTAGFIVVLSKSLQQNAMALHFAERYCHTATVTVHETRALIEYAAAMRAADLGCCADDLIRLGHPDWQGTHLLLWCFACQRCSLVLFDTT